MAFPIVPLRTDQSAALMASALRSLTTSLRNDRYELEKTRDLMRNAFDDSQGEQNIDWTQLGILWGVPIDENGDPILVNGQPAAKFLWDAVNGALMAIDGNADFQKLIKQVV